MQCWGQHYCSPYLPPLPFRFQLQHSTRSCCPIDQLTVQLMISRKVLIKVKPLSRLLIHRINASFLAGYRARCILQSDLKWENNSDEGSQGRAHYRQCKTGSSRDNKCRILQNCRQSRQTNRITFNLLHLHLPCCIYEHFTTSCSNNDSGLFETHYHVNQWASSSYFVLARRDSKSLHSSFAQIDLYNVPH